jgi:hypothetical protein
VESVLNIKRESAEMEENTVVDVESVLNIKRESAEMEENIVVDEESVLNMFVYLSHDFLSVLVLI